MAKPTEISLKVRYHADGIMDESDLLIQLEEQLGGRMKITDWVGENAIAAEYPHLSSEQRVALISSIDIGDYDDAINADVRRDVLDQSAQRAGVPRWDGDDNREDDESEADQSFGL